MSAFPSDSVASSPIKKFVPFSKRAGGGLENGRLLSAAEREFDVFITVDQSLQFQRNISGYSIAVVVL